jgi:quercetin dioxygenase-like cupin family protein
VITSCLPTPLGSPLSGSGQLATELSPVELRPGSLVWLPRRSRREFTAGPDGLMYLTVHQRRQALTLIAHGQ